jgi:hypothetical protein
MGGGVSSGTYRAVRAIRIATPIILVTAALAFLWVETPERAEPTELKAAPPPAPKAREVHYEPWELVRA